MGEKLLAIFDLGWYAPTFDIFEFALNARAWAQRHAIPRVKLVILKRRFAGALVRQPQLPPDYDFRLNDILLGASSLFAVDDVELTSDLAAVAAAAAASPERVFPPGWSAELTKEKLAPHRYYLERFVRDHLAEGGQFPGIRIPPAAFAKIAALLAPLPRPWISITVRQTPYQQLRNANLASWQAVRRHFERRGASVTFLPDLESPADLARGTPLAALAVANVVYRAALYDACDLNLAVVNGSIAPSMYNPNAAHLITKFGTAETNSSRERMQEIFGMGPGDPLFYRVPWQQALWENDDDADRLIAQAEAMLDFTAKLREAIAGAPALCDPWGKPDGTLHGAWNSIRPGMSAAAIKEKLQGLENLKASSPFSCKPWMAEAETRLASGDLQGALACAKQAIRLDGRYARPHAIAAQCLKAAGQDALAERYLATAQNLTGKK